MRFRPLVQAARPPFLVLTPVCVFLGFSTSLALQPGTDWLVLSIVFAGALTAHISVNMLNEYFDFKSGLDLHTNRTPFSGGSGALPDQHDMASAVGIAALLMLGVTVVCGLFLLAKTGTAILPFGLAGIALVLTYTQWLNRLPLFCMVAPGLGFGLLMVVGTHRVLGGEFATINWLVSLVPFFLVNNLLLLNQYPDCQADEGAGRNTLPIAYGLKAGNIAYTIQMAAAYALIFLLIARGDLPALAGLALVPAIFALVALLGACKHMSAIGRHTLYLACNVVAAIATPLLLGVAIVYG